MTVQRYVLSRLAQLPFVLLLISIATFSLIHLAPGDPVTVMLGPYWTPELEVRLRSYYGLDRPLVLQYLKWAGSVVRGDLGRSIRTGERVSALIPRRFVISLFLATITIFLTLMVAVPLGLVAASRHNTLLDYLSMFITLVGLSVPNFVLAVVLILILSVKLRWLPILGAGNLLNAPFDALQVYAMPAIALAAHRIAFVARLVRSSMLEVLDQEYIRVARAKGLTESRILLRHALRNSLIPLITVLAVEFAYLLGGVVIIEEIFVIPGMGNLLVRAVSQRDLPVFQGITLTIALVFVLSNIAADALYAVADPRIRYE